MAYGDKPKQPLNGKQRANRTMRDTHTHSCGVQHTLLPLSFLLHCGSTPVATAKPNQLHLRSVPCCITQHSSSAQKDSYSSAVGREHPNMTRPAY